MPTPTYAADKLTQQADRMGENVTKSAYDKTFKDFQLPTDPSALGRMYGGVASDLMTDLDIPSALDRSKKLGDESGVAAAAAVFENRIKGEELAKTPLSELDQEIDRLSQQRWGILPAVLGRSDIIDYGQKMKIAARAEQIMDGEITKLTQSRERIQSAAESRAKDKTEQLKAQAALLDKRSASAKNDLDARMSLFKEGKATFDDIVQAALELKKINDDRAKGSGGSGGNPFMGMMSETGQWGADMIRMFAVYEKTGEFPGVDSTKTQLKIQLVNEYGKWAQAGRPGSSIQVQKPALPLPDGTSGPPTPGGFEMKDISDLYATPAAAGTSSKASDILSAMFPDLQ